MDSEKINKILDILKDFTPAETFPPVGDSHAIATYNIYGEKAKDSYFGKEIETEEVKYNPDGSTCLVKVSGKDAKRYYKEVLRDRGKKSALAIFYGGEGYTISQKTGVTQDDADQIVNKYFQANPKVHNYIKDKKKQARENLYTTTLFHRRRYVPNISSPEYKVKLANERVSLNAPIQGTGSDQLKLMIIKLHDFYEKYKINRVANNLPNTYSDWYTRIIALDKNINIHNVETLLENIPNGNCKLIVLDGDVVTHVYGRNLQLTGAVIKEIGARVIW